MIKRIIYVWSSDFRVGKEKELDYFCCRVNICKLFQFCLAQGGQFSDIVCLTSRSGGQG